MQILGSLLGPLRRTSWPTLASGAVALYLVCTIGAPPAAAWGWGHKKKGVCFQVSGAAQNACQAGALDDYWIAVANCTNAGEDQKGPDSCKGSARDDLFAAYRDCGEQLDARNAICEKLGGGPYDPQIDPAEFSSTLSNPYLEFTTGKTFHYRTDLAGGDVETGDVTEDTLDWYAQDAAGNV
jgi:hypothetical protein